MFGGLLHSISDKQDTITVGLVDLHDDESYMLPAIVETNSAGTALNGNTIGILDADTVADDEGTIDLYNDAEYTGDSSDLDKVVPTVRAVANSLYAVQSNLGNQMQPVPWNTAEQNAVNAYSTTFSNSSNATNAWPEADAARLVKGETFANALAIKQNKKVCAGWPDGTTTPDSTHTDANCWLWEFPD